VSTPPGLLVIVQDFGAASARSLVVHAADDLLGQNVLAVSPYSSWHPLYGDALLRMQSRVG
jgi:hypothetical protein